MADLPIISRYITTFDAEGKSVFHDASIPPPSVNQGSELRIDHIYSTPGSSTGPPLADDVDLKAYHDQLAADPPLYVTFSTAGGSGAAILNVSLLFESIWESPAPDPHVRG
jgi:hypothetical protein